MNTRTCFKCKRYGHVKEFCSINDESSRKEFDLFASDNEEFCYPMIEDEIKETRKLRLPSINTMNIHDWHDKTRMELRADNPNYSNVLQYGSAKWMSMEEEVNIRELLNDGNEEVVDIHEAVRRQEYRTAAATRYYTDLDMKKRETYYKFYNAKLHGLLEKACEACPEAMVFIKLQIKNFEEMGGQLTNLSGKSLLVNLVSKFSRDTTRTKGEKLKRFYNRTMNDREFRTGMELCTTLEKDAIELARVGEFTEESIPDRLMDRFIDAISDVHRYHGLCGVLRARREDILGGLSWEALKQVVKKDDIDRTSDKYDKDRRIHG